MDEVISSSYVESESITSSIENYVNSTYSGVESMTIEDFELNSHAASGMGVVGIAVLISIASASIIRFFYHV